MAHTSSKDLADQMCAPLTNAASAQLASGNPDTAFLNAKIGTSSFYIQHLLPQATALAAAITEGGATVADFDVSGF